MRKLPHPLLEISQTLEKLSIFERSYQLDLNKRPKYKIYEQQSTDAIREQQIVAPPQTSKSFHLTPLKAPVKYRIKPPEIKLNMESTGFKLPRRKVTKTKKSTSTDKRYDDLLRKLDFSNQFYETRRIFERKTRPDKQVRFQ
ncbi:hypothetical protein pb186bvf_017189 [Paramecium bursaria]